MLTDSPENRLGRGLGSLGLAWSREGSPMEDKVTQRKEDVLQESAVQTPPCGANLKTCEIPETFLRGAIS